MQDIDIAKARMLAHLCMRFAQGDAERVKLWVKRNVRYLQMVGLGNEQILNYNPKEWVK